MILSERGLSLWFPLELEEDFLNFLSCNNLEDNINCYTCYLFLLHANAICTKLTVGYIHQSQIMRSRKKPGVIINIGSAAGLYPMFADPIYTGTKGSYTILYTSTFSYLAADHSADARTKSIGIPIMNVGFIEIYILANYFSPWFKIHATINCTKVHISVI